MSAITVENLSFSYGSNKILNDICIEIDCKQIYALLGPSGGGKSTLLKLILGTIKNKNGQIRVMGETSGLKSSANISFMPQDSGLYPHFSVNQTFNYFKNIYRLSDSEYKKRYQVLRSLLHLPNGQLLVSQLSGGTQRRLSLAIALINKPSIVILDEPTVGIDPLVRQNIWKYLVSESEHGMTSVIVTHYVEEAVCADRVGLIRNGHILAEDNPLALMSKFNTNSLEKAFLKLCLAEDRSVQLKGISFYKNQNRSLLQSCTFDTSLQEEKTYQHILSNLILKLWIIMILIHKNVLKFLNMSLSLFIVLLPATQALLFCVIYSKDTIELKTAVFNEEVSQRYSSELLSSLPMVTTDRHTIKPMNYSSLADAIQSVNATETVAAIHIPKYFSDAIDLRIADGYSADNESVMDSTISIYIDTTNVIYSNGVMRSLTDTFLKLMTKIYAENDKFFDAVAIDVERTEKTADMKIDNYYMPALYFYYLYMSQILLASLALTQERKEGLFERSLIVGVRHELVFISHLISACLLSAVQIVFLYITGFLLYDSINNSSLELLFSYLMLGSIYGISLGLLISSFFDTEIVCIIIVWFITIPQIFSSGQYWPLESMSTTQKWISYYGSPLAIPIETMRNLVLRGWDLSHNDVRIGFLWTVFPSIIWLSIALLVFKKR